MMIYPGAVVQLGPDRYGIGSNNGRLFLVDEIYDEKSMLIRPLVNRQRFIYPRSMMTVDRQATALRRAMRAASIR